MILSVPLTPQLDATMDQLVKEGVASSKAELACLAMNYYIDHLAVETVFKATQEPSLDGDLTILAQKA